MASASDNFNRANEELDASANWTERNGDWDVTSNECILTTKGTAWHNVAYHGFSPGSADYFVEVDLRTDTGAGSRFFGPCLRRVDFSTTDSDYYCVTKRASAGEMHIRKRVSGTTTQLGADFTPSITFDTWYTVKLKASGTTLELFLGGVSQGTRTDSDLSATGKAGVMSFNSDDAQQRYDNFVVDDEIAAGGDPEAGLVSGKLIRGGLLLGGALVR